MSRRSPKRSSRRDLSDSEDDIIDDLYGQKFTVPEPSVKDPPPPFADSDSDRQIDSEINTDQLPLNLGHLDVLDDYYSDPSDGTGARAKPSRRAGRDRPPPVPRVRVEEFAVPAPDPAVDTTKRSVAGSAFRFYKPGSMKAGEKRGDDEKSERTRATATVGVAARSREQRQNWAMMDLQLNPDEEQDDAYGRAVQQYKEMCLRGCPILSQNREVLQRKRDKIQSLEYTDDQLRSMSRKELIDLNRRLEAEKARIDAELAEVRTEVARAERKKAALDRNKGRRQRRARAEEDACE
jgi:hypothetical protein